MTAAATAWACFMDAASLTIAFSFSATAATMQACSFSSVGSPCIAMSRGKSCDVSNHGACVLVHIMVHVYAHTCHGTRPPWPSSVSRESERPQTASWHTWMSQHNGSAYSKYEAIQADVPTWPLLMASAVLSCSRIAPRSWARFSSWDWRSLTLSTRAEWSCKRMARH